jgi:glycerol-3-phosphate acyltransferase PlsY
MIAARVFSLLIGYVFGLLQTSYLYGKSKGIDIRDAGSGNAGTTNSIRVLGWKAGLITFIGDSFKAIFAVLAVWLIFNGRVGEDYTKLLELYAGFGAVLGHNFPFYMNFKGGKGIATTSGMILAVCPMAAPLCLLLFILAVALTRYVSLGSIIVVCAYLVQVIVFGQLGYLHLDGFLLGEFYVVSACFTAMALWKHRANIGRLLHGTENKLGAKKEVQNV